MTKDAVLQVTVAESEPDKNRYTAVIDALVTTAIGYEAIFGIIVFVHVVSGW